MTIYLPDINFWINLAFDARTDHVAARTWLENEPDRHCVFCRYTQRGFLRLATTKAAVEHQLCTMNEAWLVYGRFFNDGRIGYSQEPEDLEIPWRGYSGGTLSSPNVWNDAYLAAFANALDIEVVSFDAGFAKFPRLKLTLLK